MSLYSDYVIVFNCGMVLTLFVIVIILLADGHISDRNMLENILQLNYIKILLCICW
jgi:hypothetical protein